jgi:hypothetical protein
MACSAEGMHQDEQGKCVPATAPVHPRIHILDLPDELLVAILQNVAAADLNNVLVVCKRFDALRDDVCPTVLWRTNNMIHIMAAIENSAAPLDSMNFASPAAL